MDDLHILTVRINKAISTDVVWILSHLAPYAILPHISLNTYKSLTFVYKPRISIDYNNILLFFFT